MTRLEKETKSYQVRPGTIKGTWAIWKDGRKVKGGILSKSEAREIISVLMERELVG